MISMYLSVFCIQIAGCTIYEGIDLWGDYFNEYQDQNMPSLAFWFTGRFLQVMGLILLISHAASFQVFPEIERSGMMMLTAGPVLNMLACSLFDSGIDPLYLYNKQWMSSEVLELVGISILDLSLIDAEEYLVLTAEVTGFAILACAAILDFDYEMGKTIPRISVRLDLLHCSDCFGLFLLTVVAIMQYRMKVAKHQQHQHQQQQQQHQHQHQHQLAQADKQLHMQYNSRGTTASTHTHTSHNPGWDSQKNSDKEAYSDRVYDHRERVPLSSSHRSDPSDSAEQGRVDSDTHFSTDRPGLQHVHHMHLNQVPANKFSGSGSGSGYDHESAHHNHVGHGHSITGYRLAHLDHSSHDD
jgi:hypothetical protein